MCGVIVVDAGRSRSTCYGRDAYNYALFYQLLDSNLFTHRNTYAILREATSETYGPRVYLYHINHLLLSYFLCYLLCLYFTLHIYHKNTKILSYHIYQISLS